MRPAPREKAKKQKTVPPAPEKSDDDLFMEAMAGVREIKEFRELPVGAPRRTRPRRPPDNDPRRPLKRILEGRERISISNTAEYIEWVRPGLRRGIAEKLHRGDFSVQDYIDLHGMTLAEAEEAVRRFLAGAVRSGLSCVKVIHGRGLRSSRGPVLKDALRGWLERPLGKWVAAYVTARDCDGGLGATYVLLKR